MLRIVVVNGPNLNLIGIREPEVYGRASLEEYLKTMEQNFPEVEFLRFQSNIEGELIDFLQNCRDQVGGIIINAGGYSHTSVALADTIAALAIPTVEVHISNVFAREDFRKNSFLAPRCVGLISGLGLHGYDLAVRYFLKVPTEKNAY